ncbi:MAG: hypothetical protein ACM30I_08215 [Gemmatimonas sp.]
MTNALSPFAMPCARRTAAPRIRRATPVALPRRRKLESAGSRPLLAAHPCARRLARRGAFARGRIGAHRPRRHALRLVETPVLWTASIVLH